MLDQTSNRAHFRRTSRLNEDSNSNLIFLGLSTSDDYHQRPLSILKHRSLTTTADLQIAKGNDSSRSISDSTRLESSKLIDQAVRRFNQIESILSTQRKQSHTKCLPTNNGTHMKSTRLIANQTQS